MAEQPKKSAHEITCDAVRAMIKECTDHDLTSAEIALCCETAVVIVVSFIIKITDPPDKIQAATEYINLITERAYVRTTAQILGVPYEG